MPVTPGTKSLRVDVSVNTHNRLRIIAASRGTTMSKLARDAVETIVARYKRGAGASALLENASSEVKVLAEIFNDVLGGVSDAPGRV
jgi:hypothetical protein